MVNSPYDSSYQESYNDIYECVMGVSPPKGGGRAVEGGKAIASGGFGCVLRPAVKCEGERSRREDSISKLLTTEAAKSEMKEISDALVVVKHIPDYAKYFALTDYTMCVPDKLTKEDRKQFNYECAEPLGITTKDFNQLRRSKVRAIISPDLGTDVSKGLKSLLSDGPSNLKQFLGKFNIKAADFLENGIAKLQKHHYYHSDVKPQNMMTDLKVNKIEQSFNYIKLIDFGLALPLDATARDVNTSFLFNFPLTSLFFDTENAQSLNRKIQRSLDNGKLTQKAQKALTGELKEYAKYLFYTSRLGHIPYLLEIGPIAYNMTQSQFSEYMVQLWSEYVLHAIIATSKTMKQSNNDIHFSRQPYWDAVYKYNLDVWGFLTSFLMLASYANRYGHSAIGSLYLERIVKKYLYNPIYGGKRIPVRDVCTELRAIAKEFDYSEESLPTKHAAKKKTLKTITNFDNNLPVLDLIGKRCPYGTVRHKTIKRKCVKKAITVKKLGEAHSSSEKKMKKPSKVRSVATQRPNSKRRGCPRGYIRNKTYKNKCVKK